MGTDMFNSSHRGDNSDPDSDRMDDPFENMREQMDRQRDEFFNLNPRDWPSDSSNLRSGFFNKPRTSFGGFPSGSATMRPRYMPQEFPDDDFSMSGHRSLPRNRRENLGGQTQEAEGGEAPAEAKPEEKMETGEAKPEEKKEVKMVKRKKVVNKTIDLPISQRVNGQLSSER